MTLTPIAERVAVNLSLPVCTTYLSPKLYNLSLNIVLKLLPLFCLRVVKCPQIANSLTALNTVNIRKLFVQIEFSSAIHTVWITEISNFSCKFIVIIIGYLVHQKYTFTNCHYIFCEISRFKIQYYTNFHCYFLFFT